MKMYSLTSKFDSPNV